MSGNTFRLLIAEDEYYVRGGMENYVSTNTTVFDAVYGAATGQEALDLIFRYRPQMMLLDIQMPVKGRPDGAERGHRRRPLPQNHYFIGT